MKRLLDNSQLAKQPSITRTKRPRMAVFGEWNTTNLGDRAIFSGVQTFCQASGWDVDAYGLGTLTPISINSIVTQQIAEYSTQQQISNQHSSLNQSNRLGHGLYRHVKQIARGIRQHHRMQRLLPQLSRADAILVGGGSLLSDHRLHFPQSLIEIAQASKRLGLPLLCLGCGAVEDWSPKGKAMITEFAQECTFIAVRDQETSSRLEAILSAPVPIFGDFALNFISLSESNNESATLAINVMQLIDQQEGYQSHYEAALVEVAKHWLEQHPQQVVIKIFTTGTCEDIRPAERVAEQIGSRRVSLCKPANVKHLNQFLQQSSAVLASRLHAAILAISQGIPVIGLGAGHVSLKLYNFLESLGINDYSISVLEANAVSRTLEILNRKTLKKQTAHLDLLDLHQTREQVTTLLNHLTLQNL